jgi:hypothetical protein
MDAQLTIPEKSNEACVVLIVNVACKVENLYRGGMPLHLADPHRSVFSILNQTKVDELASKPPGELQATLKGHVLLMTDAEVLASALRDPGFPLKKLPTKCSCKQPKGDCLCSFFGLLIAIEGFGNTVEIHGNISSFRAYDLDFLT